MALHDSTCTLANSRVAQHDMYPHIQDTYTQSRSAHETLFAYEIHVLGSCSFWLEAGHTRHCRSLIYVSYQSRVALAIVFVLDPALKLVFET